MKKRIWLAIFFMALAVFMTAGAAFAQGETPNEPSDDEVNAIAKQMYCPVCENTPLDVCPTQACAEWRELIRDKLAEGWTEAQIKQYFVEQFGDRVLAEPPRQGLNWLAYVIPPLAFLVGVYILYRALLTWRQSAPPAVAAVESDENASEGDAYVERLEEELKKLG